MIDRRRDDIRLQHHPRPAARWRIIDGTVLVGGEIPDMDRIERPPPLAQRSPGERYAATNSFAIKAEIGKLGATHDH